MLDRELINVYKVISKGVMKTSCGRNSVVECQLPKLNVVGSNPIARFIYIFFIFNDLRQIAFAALFLILAKIQRRFV